MTIRWTETEQTIVINGARKILRFYPHMSSMKAIRQAMLTLLPADRQRPGLNAVHVPHLLQSINTRIDPEMETKMEVEVNEVIQQSNTNTNTVDLLAEVLESVLVQTIKRLLSNPEISTILQQLLNKSK